MKKVISLNKN